ncbi:glycogen/starch/alpha-glucan family phosphorylase [Francisella sp. 19X1-34]|uniref:glycogen/starch/alpha-glucan family phosphorylase n=1 Tax=Francisella sp. 19X1-34 TaxID=3087177 RepID=UPI002E36F91D|nr:glycogen/starch/alpha-glucan family phosphorylase [Francisella sp. 19X1-34]MED7787614.1 glycogen/starch/alpha-glucan family phosphorylase [Francisella sp. 19X1-34]
MNEKNQIELYLEKVLNCDVSQANDQDLYYALLGYAKEQTEKLPEQNYKKKIYYISSEFLIGKMLISNLINLGVYNDVCQILKDSGKDIVQIEEFEPEPSLGNGGLGRLAACFLDSIASLGIPGTGISLNYHYGLFKQKFKNHSQSEKPNPWIEKLGWLNKTNVSYKVDFNDFSVKSQLCEIDVVGYKNNFVNKLCLFDIASVDPDVIEDDITFDKTAIEKNLTLFLYPDDSDEDGHLLRIFQQYFMVSNAVSLIFSDITKNGYSLESLPEHAVVQINDTHPTLVIPELIRQLVANGIDIDRAIELVSKTTAYTNHTILAEALEKWPLSYLEKVLSKEMVGIIKYLDRKVKEQYKDHDLAIIDDNNCVHMAHICIHYSFSVNGVAALHTDILKNSELKHFNDIYPTKFNNKTNGITFRRWLLQANPELASYLKSLVGDSFIQDSKQLEKLLAYHNDKNVLAKLDEIKKTKKEQFIEFASYYSGVDLLKDGIFDVQIKRIHEYKRQQMNALYIIHKYLEIKSGLYPKPKRPINFIFGGKAAPAYTIAKHIIHLVLCLQELINNDEEVNKHIRVLFVENYNVSVAEKLIPATDVSEQISLASKEASGTGNMKFMLNGAITLGTMDGANVEIAELVGSANIYTFGKDSDTIIDLYKTNGYKSIDYYHNPVIKNVVDFIISPTLVSIGDKDKLIALFNELISKDWFMTLIDLVEYIKVKDQVFRDYEDREHWLRMSLVNTAKSGFFSSDRTISQYNKHIWKI